MICIDGIADLVFNNLYGSSSTFYKDMTEFLYMDEECLLAKTPKPHPKWQALFRPMSLTVWLTALITFIVSLIFIYGYIICYRETTEFNFSQVGLSSLKYKFNDINFYRLCGDPILIKFCSRLLHENCLSVKNHSTNAHYITL